MAISGAICMSVGQSPTTTTVPTAHSPPLSFFSIALGTAASRGQRLLPYQQSSLGWQGSTPHTASLLSTGLGQKWAVRSPRSHTPCEGLGASTAWRSAWEVVMDYCPKTRAQ